MLQDLDATLAALVQAELSVRNVTISFDGPDEQFPPPVRRAPARVDCSYLITAWPSGSAPDPAADEHRLLGEVMTVLLRHRTIPETYLRGALAGQDPPVRAKIMTENQLQSIGEFWQAMGGRPKATLHYGVTLSLDLFAPSDVGPQVMERIFKITQGPSPR
jgi:Pvc16 N-terminal domain